MKKEEEIDADDDGKGVVGEHDDVDKEDDQVDDDDDDGDDDDDDVNDDDDDDDPEPMRGSRYGSCSIKPPHCTPD